MTGITEIKMACNHVDQSDEHRDEHAMLIVFSR